MLFGVYASMSLIHLHATSRQDQIGIVTKCMSAGNTVTGLLWDVYVPLM